MALDPTQLMRLSTAYWESQTFLTANRIGLFDLLAGKCLSVDAIAGALATQPRQTSLFLRACVGLGLLEESPQGFRNSAVSEVFLVDGKPSYMGNAFRYSDDLYATWGQLETALKSGEPPMRAEQYLGVDPQRTRHFVYGMHNRALGIGRAMVHLADIENRGELLDVGGGPGTFSALFAQKHPTLRATVLDLHAIVEIAKEIVASMGVGDRVTTLAGDYTTTAFPTERDVVLMSGIFHRETPDRCRALIKKGFASLKPNGMLIVSDVLTDASGATPAFAALFGLNMMLTAPDGGVHSVTDVATWMKDAGFVEIKTRDFPPPMPHKMAFGIKR